MNNCKKIILIFLILFQSLCAWPQSFTQGTGFWQKTQPVFNLIISANISNFNIRTAAMAAGWDGSSIATINITINAGVVVKSTSAATAAFDTGITTGSSVTLINNGSITGMGGAGGNGAYWASNGSGGENGGIALNVQSSLTVTNNGIIAGGGGGGGGGGGTSQGGNYCVGGGGGGGGAGNSAGASAPGPGCNFYPGGTSASGTATTGGGGGSGASDGARTGGNGGAGGNLGSPGAGGACATNPYGDGWGLTCGGSGGAAGPSVKGNSNVTWTATGTRTGPVN